MAQVLFLTQGFLAQLIPENILEEASVVILDEVHVRRGYLSFILWAIRRFQERRGTRLRVILMSAHCDVQTMRGFFDNDVGVVTVDGRRFPVERSEVCTALPDGDVDEQVVLRVVMLALDIVAKNDTDSKRLGRDCLLIFLKGKAEIARVTDLLKNTGWDEHNTINERQNSKPHKLILNVHRK